MYHLQVTQTNNNSGHKILKNTFYLTTQTVTLSPVKKICQFTCYVYHWISKKNLFQFRLWKSKKLCQCELCCLSTITQNKTLQKRLLTYAEL